MNIAIDGYEANVRNRVGIGSYAYETLNGLYDLMKKNQTSNVTVYLPTNPLEDLPLETSWWKYIILKPRSLWTFIGLPMGIMKSPQKPDVIFSPTHYIPRFLTIPRVMSIMDMSYLEYPGLFKKKDLYQLVHWTEYSVKRAKAVFTISEFSRNAIIKAYNIPSSRIVVTYPGFRMTTTIKKYSVQEVYNLHKPYILSVGTLQPRKNFSKLIEAFSLIKQLPDFKEYELVIVGKKGWLYEEILDSPKKNNVESSVKFLDFVPDEHLPELYKQGACFVLPSLYEGFGLPVLEAMAYGIPIVVSNVSSLPEIAGDAGVMIKPEDTEDIAAGIKKALLEKQTPAGRRRIEIGLERVDLFSWDSAAKKTLDILEQVGRGEL